MTTAIDMTPGSADWLKRLTASRFGRLMLGPGAWRSLRREMLSPPRDGGSASTDHGKENEPRARALYSIETGRDVIEPGFKALPGNPRIGATVDGLTSCGRVLEIKCPTVLGRHYMARQGIFDQAYFWQMQGGCWVWEADVCDYLSFSPLVPVEESLFIVPVDRDERAIAKLRDNALRFLDWFDQDDEDAVTHDFINPGTSTMPKLF